MRDRFKSACDFRRPSKVEQMQFSLRMEFVKIFDEIENRLDLRGCGR
jgi:hypothetical protein